MVMLPELVFRSRRTILPSLAVIDAPLDTVRLPAPATTVTEPLLAAMLPTVSPEFVVDIAKDVPALPLTVTVPAIVPCDTLTELLLDTRLVSPAPASRSPVPLITRPPPVADNDSWL